MGGSVKVKYRWLIIAGLIASSVTLLIVMVAVASVLNESIPLTNQNFLSDIDGWTENGTCSVIEWAENGHDDAGSAHLVNGDEQCGLYQIVAISDSIIYTVSGWVSGSVGSTHFIGVDSFACEFDGVGDWAHEVCSGTAYGSEETPGVWTLSSGAEYHVDNLTLDKYVEPSSTPTPTPIPTSTPYSGSPTTVNIMLSSGQTFNIVYEWTFGGMAIVAALLILITLFAGRWLYDVIYQLWTWRRM
jgi:hypothetical protein